MDASFNPRAALSVFFAALLLLAARPPPGAEARALLSEGKTPGAQGSPLSTKTVSQVLDEHVEAASLPYTVANLISLKRHLLTDSVTTISLELLQQLLAQIQTLIEIQTAVQAGTLSPNEAQEKAAQSASMFQTITTQVQTLATAYGQ